MQNSTADQNQFKTLDNLDKAHKLHRIVVIAVLIIAAIIVISSLTFAFNVYKDSSNSMYAFDSASGKAVKLEKVGISDNKEAEIKHHMQEFYRLFLTLDPDADMINENIDKALFLGGESVKKLYEFYLEDGFYNQFIQNNISSKQELKLEDIEVDTSVYPYKCIAKGKQIHIRSSNMQINTFNCECRLRNVARTENNSHGLQIIDLVVTDNQKIE